MKLFASWSGGKDSCLALYKAIVNGFNVTYLLNFIDEKGNRSRTHGIRARLLFAQSNAVGIPVVQRATSWNTYEQKFKEVVIELKQRGIEGGIFGDIDLEEHRDWVERVCADVGIKPVLPLWGKNRELLINEFIDLGFEAVIVTTKSDLLGKEWLGRNIDRKFLKDVSYMNGIDLSGEMGEYHTFVLDGPNFKRRIEILETNIESREGYNFLDIVKYRVEKK